MKKYLFITISMVLIASCSVKTNEEKARELIEPDVKEHLIKPESFQFAEFQLDSCFKDDPRNPESMIFSLKLIKLYNEYKEFSKEAERAESYMTIYDSSYGYQSAHSKLQEEKYKAEMERARHKVSMVKDKIFQLYKDNQHMLENINNGNHELMGWVAYFSFRTETAGGHKTMGVAVYYLNKELNKITHRLSEEELKNIERNNIDDLKYELREDLSEMFGNQKQYE